MSNEPLKNQAPEELNKISAKELVEWKTRSSLPSMISSSDLQKKLMELIDKGVCIDFLVKDTEYFSVITAKSFVSFLEECIIQRDEKSIAVIMKSESVLELLSIDMQTAYNLVIKSIDHNISELVVDITSASAHLLSQDPINLVNIIATRHNAVVKFV